MKSSVSVPGPAAGVLTRTDPFRPPHPPPGRQYGHQRQATPATSRHKCECGCGQPTAIATRTDRRYDRVKGQPLRFIPGHNLLLRRAVRRAAVPPAKVGPEVHRCLRCPYPLVPGRHDAPPGWKVHCGRGLCEGCWYAAATTGELIDFERPTRTRDEVLDEWVLLRSDGDTRAQAAARLGMTVEAFDRAWYRARRDGDPRALPALGDLRRREAS